ncbi:MAG: ABC transporter ATP-binding protein [Desulfarculales bacterium]|jgi:NitT/TauT family transport system ATP-binding protein/sulfonate transport system ATP-binding protein|nr:ABC transporter ATP-binding protein [Desulfarculales bacterium]
MVAVFKNLFNLSLADDNDEKKGKLSGSISVDRVVKSFIQNDGGRVVALSGVSLEVGGGEFVSLIGPSGCGKSTLLRLIAGLNRADSGSLYLDGEKITQPEYQRGLVFQNPLLFPWLNIHSNVAFGLRARKIYRENKNEVEKFLKLVGLEKFGRAYPHQLSGGMAQRASLARALINRPRVLLLDEPLGALDAFTRMNMQDEILRIWRERKITMIMVTHDVDEAIYLSDRVVVMSPGPAKIDTVLDVPFSRPRARSNPDFLLLRSSILKILNYGGQIVEPTYQI